MTINYYTGKECTHCEGYGSDLAPPYINPLTMPSDCAHCIGSGKEVNWVNYYKFLGELLDKQQRAKRLLHTALNS